MKENKDNKKIENKTTKPQNVQQHKSGYKGKNYDPNYKKNKNKPEVNSNYKGKNYDPNYKKDKNQQEVNTNYKGKNYDPNFNKNKNKSKVNSNKKVSYADDRLNQNSKKVKVEQSSKEDQNKSKPKINPKLRRYIRNFVSGFLKRRLNLKDTKIVNLNYKSKYSNLAFIKKIPNSYQTYNKKGKSSNLESRKTVKILNPKSSSKKNDKILPKIVKFKSKDPKNIEKVKRIKVLKHKKAIKTFNDRIHTINLDRYQQLRGDKVLKAKEKFLALAKIINERPIVLKEDPNLIMLAEKLKERTQKLKTIKPESKEGILKASFLLNKLLLRRKAKALQKKLLKKEEIQSKKNLKKNFYKFFESAEDKKNEKNKINAKSKHRTKKKQSRPQTILKRRPKKLTYIKELVTENATFSKNRVNYVNPSVLITKLKQFVYSMYKFSEIIKGQRELALKIHFKNLVLRKKRIQKLLKMKKKIAKNKKFGKNNKNKFSHSIKKKTLLAPKIPHKTLWIYSDFPEIKQKLNLALRVLKRKYRITSRRPGTNLLSEIRIVDLVTIVQLRNAKSQQDFPLAIIFVEKPSRELVNNCLRFNISLLYVLSQDADDTMGLTVNIPINILSIRRIFWLISLLGSLEERIVRKKDRIILEKRRKEKERNRRLVPRRQIKEVEKDEHK